MRAYLADETPPQVERSRALMSCHRQRTLQLAILEPGAVRPLAAPPEWKAGERSPSRPQTTYRVSAQKTRHQ